MPRSYIWRWKHNTYHHQFPNIQGLDDDIDLGVLCRMGPDQPLRRFHRYQHIYMWALYCFLVVKWHFFDDMANLLKGRIGDQPFPRPRGKDLVIIIIGKIVFLGLAFGIPLLIHPWWIVLSFYLLVTAVVSVTLSLVFQMAHCTDEAAFIPGSTEARRLEEEWAVHQVESTVNFAPKNRLLTWYTGSLNYQIEHHLFPRICHVHLPALSGIIKEVCQEYGVRYIVHENFRDALAAHYAWLFLMGRQVKAVS
jgi:linoleoyl-CoA desaturase